MKVMTKIYRSCLNCQVDTCTDEGLETSDHFSSYRLSLKLKPLSRLRWRGGGGGVSIVILMPSIVLR